MISILRTVTSLAIWVAPLISGERDVALLKAVSTGDLTQVKRWIAQQGNINYQHEATVKGVPFKDKITPLMLAAMRGRVEVFELLLNSGANPNLTDGDGATAGNYVLLVGKDFPAQRRAAMIAAFGAKGGKTTVLEGVRNFNFVALKPVSPDCYEFETPPCGTQKAYDPPAK